ncbi:RNA pseudouridylate synthase [Nitzschia inconspicua]|uniref:RNA pseudouridylate synthase n=1 Tax=Nitzschia inconspicua TaxID=303405 RepID=A0A9K3L669_9STRA|nr:RNA pseudouridylate synthase [Nitzschia inconspicua]
MWKFSIAPGVLFRLAIPFHYCFHIQNAWRLSTIPTASRPLFWSLSESVLINHFPPPGPSHRHYAVSTDIIEFSSNLPSWKGSTVPFSEYAVHVQASSLDVPVNVSDAILRSMGDKVSSENEFSFIDSVLIAKSLATHPPDAPMTPHQLLFLGSVWYLSAEEYQHNQQMIQHSSFKPKRLTLENATLPLQEGDYLRIHHTPRRFPQVYQADWSLSTTTEDKKAATTLTKVVVQQGPGYCIIDKPPLIPVHPTVDNVIENVVHQLQASSEGSDGGYLAPVQRLDTNTSGLLVLATTPEFAAYFAKLLRHKTKNRNYDNAGQQHVNNNAMNATSNTIQKGYKCLVCLAETGTESVVDAWQRLRNLQTTSQDSSSSPMVVIRHYLEQSDRAPKRFVRQRPTEDNKDQWLECLLQITEVGPPIALYDDNNNNNMSEDALTTSSTSLVNELWAKNQRGSGVPHNVRAVAEVQVSLITGRTHQIRGQLSELGFPIVGDEQYGGAIPWTDRDHYQGTSSSTQLLALQCCDLSFPDVDYETTWNRKRCRDIVLGTPNNARPRIQASLSRAWWTSPVEKYRSSHTMFGTIDQNLEDEGDNANANVSTQPETSAEGTVVRPDLLPPTTQLSPGRNKYILAKLRDPVTHKLRWFVKSAAPSECGGPYHANVADDLIEWINSVPGYESVKVEITGGGRIDYVPDAASSTFDGASSSTDAGTVCVYGFSYRYGKGDHRRAAEIIQESMGNDRVCVTYDLADDLY